MRNHNVPIKNIDRLGRMEGLLYQDFGFTGTLIHRGPIHYRLDQPSAIARLLTTPGTVHVIVVKDSGHAHVYLPPAREVGGVEEEIKMEEEETE